MRGGGLVQMGAGLVQVGYGRIKGTNVAKGQMLGGGCKEAKGQMLEGFWKGFLPPSEFLIY